DTRHPISRGAPRLWRGMTLTIVLALACCLTLVTFYPVPSAAENPKGDATTALDEATINETDSGRTAVDADTPASAADQTGDPETRTNAAPASSTSEDAKGNLPATADAVSEDAATRRQPKDPSAAAPVTGAPAIRFDAVLLSVDNAQLHPMTMMK